MSNSQSRALCVISASSTLEAANDWLCASRRDLPANADVWSWRANWPREKATIQATLATGRYTFSLLTTVTSAKGDDIHLWSARDALVLKALTSVLADILPISQCCTHVRGHGGLKGAIRRVARDLPGHRFVIRTDVKSYYASIDHAALIERLKRHIRDERVLGLVRQYLNRTSERGGVFTDFDKGISLGCPLSPLMGAFFISDLDARMERLMARQGLTYVRYMDDILVLAPTRWKLRGIVSAVNEELAALGLEKHPDKTFIGRIARGFDFLGYHFSPDGLGLAHRTIDNFQTKLSRLYEQGRRSMRRDERQTVEATINTYIRRWRGWVSGGLSNAHLATSDLAMGDHLWHGPSYK